MEYKPTIGLEIHAELKTRTKMFCDSKNDPDERRPNVNICPVCMAHPGTLPVINKQAVKYTLMVGLALGSRLADFTEFDRKNYFYPDLPKGYQISQYEFPLVSGGELSGVEITRIHLEEDTARSLHTESTGNSLVDFNRGGIPLMELVTEPVIHDSATAGKFARELQLLLRTLGVSNANMEKGEMRVEANISVSKTSIFGTKVEVKNLNSFRSVERAIEHEIQRQTNVLQGGGEVLQETRGWDEDKQKTFSQRIKEEAADYRYFPDPDLPKLKISEVPEFAEDVLRAQMPELPSELREKYTVEFGIKTEDAEVYIIDRTLGKFFEGVAEELSNSTDADINVKLASNYITNNLVTLRDNINHGLTEYITPGSFAKVVIAAQAGEISSNSAVEIIEELVQSEGVGNIVEELINARKQKSDEGELSKVIDAIIAEYTGVVEEYKAGKETALRFLVGQGMKATDGKANPAKLASMLKERLG